MIDEIINQKIACDEAEVDVPHIFTEFGSFTVGESGGAIYQILYQKQQNDREKWNMIDSSLLLLYLILGQSITFYYVSSQPLE
jgi:arginine decarboxylase